jgi:sialic acid synthase SpsE
MERMGRVESLAIGGRKVGPGERPWVIAEIGANHNGDMDLCRRHVDAAKAAGADAVKFQSWSKDSLISRPEYARNTRYAKLDPSALTLERAVERYQFTPEQHREIAAYCRTAEITFFSSAFARVEVELLESLNVPVHKIASMDVNHLPLLDIVAATGKPVILSTGMATLGEIERALDRLRRGGSGPVALLHCVSIYPCPPAETNLRNIPMLAATFGVPVGFSDHTAGSAAAIAAVALGACVIEKHFTIDKTLEGWDHAISADPPELAAIVQGSAFVFEALGRSERVIGAAEVEKRRAFRRRAVARRALAKGSRISAEDLEFKRPGNGVGPDEMDRVVGRVLARDLAAEEELEWSDLG